MLFIPLSSENKIIVNNVLYNPNIFTPQEIQILHNMQLKKITDRITFCEKPHTAYENMYVINLIHRTDRYAEIIQDPIYKGFNINWFDAYFSQRGFLGCAMSHMALIYYAKIKKFKWILIIEDDNVFNFQIEKIYGIIDKLRKNMNRWSIFNASPTMWDLMKNVDKSNRILHKYRAFSPEFTNLDWGQSTNFMIYTDKIYDQLLAYVSCIYNGETIHIDQYISKYFNTISYLGSNDYMAGQRVSKSDINMTKTPVDMTTYYKNSKKYIDNFELSYQPVVGIYGIFIGKYVKYYEEFIKNVDKFFVPQARKIYLIITDQSLPTFNLDVHFVNKKFIGWPYETLYRYKYFLDFAKSEYLFSCDYVFFLNANARLFVPIPFNDVCFDKKLTCTIHNGYHNKPYDECTFERRKESKAYVSPEDYKYYVGGRFFGGPTEMFIQLCEHLDKNIINDEQRNIIAEWHDESHLNWYVNSHKKCPIVFLMPEYHVPSEIFNQFKKIKIVYLDKTHDSQHLIGLPLHNKKGGNVIGNDHNANIVKSV